MSTDWNTRWSELLVWWNHYLLHEDYHDTVQEAQLSPQIVASGWLGRAGATDDQITTVEQRLKTSLPPSYRAFLQYTDGWHVTTLGNNSPLWPVNEIDWLKSKSPVLVDECLDRQRNPQQYPFVPLPNVADAENMVNLFHLQAALQISGITRYNEPPYYQSVYVLNPGVVQEDGEWEAWSVVVPFPGSRFVGAYRYPSFYAMIEDEWSDYPNLH